MLEKMVLNNNNNAITLVWSNSPIETIKAYDYSYHAEICNMYDNGVITYKNDRITVYERPTENRGCNAYDNKARCIAIANELDTIAGGDMIRCPICGELVSKPFEEGEDIELECGCKIDIDDYDDIEPVSMYEYFEDRIYNTKYIVDDDLNYISACVMIACGGPNIWISTESETVELYWWGDHASATLSTAAVNKIDEYFSELYSCRLEAK